MNGLQAIARSFGVRRHAELLSMDDYAQLFSLDSPLFANIAALRADIEQPDPTFVGLAAGVYARSGPVFASLMARAKLFSQARFQFQQLFGGRTGALFGTPDLTVLEHPEPGETTSDLLLRGILDADLEGDWFVVRRGVGGSDRLKRLRPDWTTVVLGSKNPDADPRLLGLDPDTEIVGFAYQPGGPTAGHDVIAFGREEVAHFHPTPNPLSRYRGIPILLSVLREILADSAATSHKLAFFRNGATPAIAISVPPGWDDKKTKSWIEQFERKHTGAMKAYKSLYFNAGMKAEMIGTNFQQQTFIELQGAAESRIASITGVHPVLLGFSEGLKGSSLSVGNFPAAARNTADVTMRWLWSNVCGSLEIVVPPPGGGSRLWYDEKSIPFLQADVKDQAEVMMSNMTTVTGYVKEGFTPASAIDVVDSGDITRLVHTGLVSVQLQPPGNELPTTGASQMPARMFSVSIPRLRELLASGWRPATASDEVLIRDVLSRDPLGDFMSNVGASSYRVKADFWASSGPLAEIGTFSAGMIVPAGHPIVRAYPSMLVPVDPVTVSVDSPTRRIAAGPALIITTEVVVAKKAELEAAGRPAGYDSLAAELSVSRDTIRRRLNEVAVVQQHQAEIQRNQGTGRHPQLAHPATP